MSEDRVIDFPCRSLPEDPALARLLGLYPQRGGELLMQRVRIPGGRITIAEWRGLARLAQRHTPDSPLHLTTRQDVEFHGLRPQYVPALQLGLHEHGFTSVGACGDTLRNVVVCPGSGLHAGTWDVFPLAGAIQAAVEALPWIRSLPRKFKISLSGCPGGCARPWINDVGLAANADGRFSATLAGSLGAKPGAGLLYEPSLPARDVIPLVRAALRLFEALGDRRRRNRARLRHVRESLGDAEFRRRIDELLEDERASYSPPPPALCLVENASLLQARVPLPLGDIAAEAALTLADAVEAAGAELRIGLDQNLLVFGSTPVALPPPLESLADGPVIITCPGTTWCARAIADCRAVAERIRPLLPAGCRARIGINGCPNNCAMAAVADIGLIGGASRVGDGRVDSYRVLVGGGNGQTPALAREIASAVPADDAPAAVARAVQEHFPTL